MRASLIINPNSGPKSTIQEINKAIEILNKNGVEVRKHVSNSSSEARKLTKIALEENMDLVIVAGGDGTVNEVSNILANTKMPIAIIPTGTANVFAKEIGLPARTFLNSDYINKCIDIIISNKSKQIDLGKITLENGLSKHFVMWCGIGLDAALTGAKSSPPESFIGRVINYLKWFINILILSLTFSGTKANFKISEKEFKEDIIQILVSNGRFYANYFKISNKSNIYDGVLDILVIKSKNKIYLLSILIKSILNKKLVADLTTQEKNIYISTEKPLPIHLDAEMIGTTPVKIEIVPKALSVIVP